MNWLSKLCIYIHTAPILSILLVHRYEESLYPGYNWMYSSIDEFSSNGRVCSSFNAVCLGDIPCKKCECPIKKHFLTENIGCKNFADAVTELGVTDNLAVAESVKDIPMLLTTDIKNKSVRLVAFGNVQHFAFENPNVNCEYNKVSYFNTSGNGQWEPDPFLPPDAFRITNNRVLGYKHLDFNLPAEDMYYEEGKILRVHIGCTFNTNDFEVNFLFKVNGTFSYGQSFLPSTTDSLYQTSDPSYPTSSSDTSYTTSTTTTATTTTTTTATTVTSTKISDDATQMISSETGGTSNQTTTIAIAVGVVMGVLLIAIIIVLIMICYKRRSKRLKGGHVHLDDVSQQMPDGAPSKTYANPIASYNSSEERYEELDDKTANTAYSYIKPQDLLNSRDTTNMYYAPSDSPMNAISNPAYNKNYNELNHQAKQENSHDTLNMYYAPSESNQNPNIKNPQVDENYEELNVNTISQAGNQYETANMYYTPSDKTGNQVPSSQTKNPLYGGNYEDGLNTNGITNNNPNEEIYEVCKF